MKNQESGADENSNAPETDQKKSLRKSWKSSGPVAKLTAVFAGVAALATVIYACASVWQMIELGESNRINREALESVQRAFLSFHQFEQAPIFDVKGVDVPYWQFTADFENGGTTYARGAIAYFDIQELSGNPTEEQFEGNKENLNTVSIAPRAQLGVGIKNVPEMVLLGTNLGSAITVEDPYRTHLNRNLHLWGWILYRDVFPKTSPHLTEFCFYISGANLNLNMRPVGIVFNFGLCGGPHNCQDGDCKDYQEMVKRFYSK